MLEASTCVHPIRIPLELILNLLERCPGLLELVGASRSRVVLFGASGHFYLPSLLHELVEHFVLQDRVVNELEVFEVFDRVRLLALRADCSGQKASSVPRELHVRIAIIDGHPCVGLADSTICTDVD